MRPDKRSSPLEIMMTDRNIKFPREKRTEIQTDFKVLNHEQSTNSCKVILLFE